MILEKIMFVLRVVQENTKTLRLKLHARLVESTTTLRQSQHSPRTVNAMRDTLHTLQLQTRAKRARLESTRALQQVMWYVPIVYLIRTLLQVQIAVMIAGASQVTNTLMRPMMHCLSVYLVKSVHTNLMQTKMTAMHALTLILKQR